MTQTLEPEITEIEDDAIESLKSLRAPEAKDLKMPTVSLSRSAGFIDFLQDIVVLLVMRRERQAEPAQSDEPDPGSAQVS